jgi:hypothetical protein
MRKSLQVLTLTVVGVSLAAVMLLDGSESVSVPSSASLVATNVRPVCPGSVVTVGLDDVVPCDVVPPQRLDVVIGRWYPDPALTCDDLGGILRPVIVGDPSSDWVCEGADY